ncbi:unnamed protein product [Rotaria sp. Silwood2]|nr:unnamed protein product [Rotaria sp. Silwood2]
MSVMERLDNGLYEELHRELILRPTRREREKQQQQKDMISNPNQLSSIQTEQQRECWNKKEIRVHFTFESCPMLDSKYQLSRLWQKYSIYPGSPMKNVTLQISTTTNKSLSQLLIKKKPPRSMLINVDSTNTKLIKKPNYTSNNSSYHSYCSPCLEDKNRVHSIENCLLILLIKKACVFPDSFPHA